MFEPRCRTQRYLYTVSPSRLVLATPILQHTQSGRCVLLVRRPQRACRMTLEDWDVGCGHATYGHSTPVVMAVREITEREYFSYGVMQYINRGNVQMTISTKHAPIEEQLRQINELLEDRRTKLD